jgi:transposase InsO family protein
MRIWVMNHTGAPSLVRLDAAGEHTSQEFREIATSSGIELVLSPVEAHWSLGTGERIHSSLRFIFQKHIASQTLSYVTKLKAADFAFNCKPPRTVIPPSVLVYEQISVLPCAGTEAAPHLYQMTQELDSCLSLVLKQKFNTRDVDS